MPFTDEEKKERRKEAAQRYHVKHRDYINAKTKAWYEEHKNDPELKARNAKNGRLWREKNREQYLSNRRRQKKAKMQDARYRELEAVKQSVRRRKRRDALTAVVAKAKTKGCSQCGEREPICLDFHHRDPAVKKFNISSVRVVVPSVARLNDELAKCDLVCGNCHWKQHGGRFARVAKDPANEETMRGARRRQQREEKWSHTVARAKRSGCTLCPEDNHACLQFHHLDPKTKVFYVGSYRTAPLRHDLWLEIQKTLVLCVNCHRRVHFGIATLPQVSLEDYWRERLAA